MVTKQEVLNIYNAERGTNYTLQELGAELLKNALINEWRSYKQRTQVIDDVV